MAYAIKDLNTHQYYRQRAGDGWYSDNLDHARLFASEKAAQRTISQGNHNVTYPGDRNLCVVEVQLVEV